MNSTTSCAAQARRAHLTNRQFLELIFGAEWERAHVTGFFEDPYALEALGWQHYWAGTSAKRRLGSLSERSNNYWTISLFHPEPGTGRARRRKALFEANYGFMVDDVGPKVDGEKVLAKIGSPAVRLRTSPGNEQWDYIWNEPITDIRLAEAILDGLVKAGISIDGKDPGMKGVTRYGRLPVGTNTKKKYGPRGFAHELVEVNREARVTPGQVAAAYGIDISEEALQARAMGAHFYGPGDGGIQPGDGQDVFLDALNMLGMVKGRASGPGWWDITCPWVHEHTGGVDNGSAYLAGRGTMKCHHKCENKRAPEFHARLDELVREDSGGLMTLAGLDMGRSPEPTDDELAQLREWSDLRAAQYGGNEETECALPPSTPVVTEAEIDAAMDEAFAKALAWRAAP
ncbi:MAG: hypothetical protein WCJ64_07755 [Rhodospirillaceae bacterium]